MRVRSFIGSLHCRGHRPPPSVPAPARVQRTRGRRGVGTPPPCTWRASTCRQQLPAPRGSRVIEMVVVHIPARRSASRAMRLAERNGRGHCEAVDSEPTESPTRKAGPQLRKPRRSSSAARGTVSEPSHVGNSGVQMLRFFTSNLILHPFLPPPPLGPSKNRCKRTVRANAFNERRCC